MGKLLLSVLFLILASPALAGTRVVVKGHATQDADAQEAAREVALEKRLNDHPRASVLSNDNIEVKITADRILRSCCRPPDLVVAGKVTNLTSKPMDFVKFLLAFEDAQGKVLYAESFYNTKAASLNDDADTARALHEKPHFTPLTPGEVDTFSDSIPLILLPRCDKVELIANDHQP